MKAISLWQPWASLIAMGLKKYETRSWSTSYRGPLLICSAQKTSVEQADIFFKIYRKHQFGYMDWCDLPKGCAIALVQLTDCIKMDEAFIQQQTELEIDCGEWSPGRYAWRLEEVKAIVPPIPVKGRQGLFNLEISFTGVA